MNDYTITRDAWKNLNASTVIDLGFDRRRLRVSTCKGGAGIVSRASVEQVTEDGLGYTHAFGLAGGGDFSERLATVPGARCTEKALRTAHEAALRALPEIEARARAHYATATA